jgi:hypothetical protein
VGLAYAKTSFWQGFPAVSPPKKKFYQEKGVASQLWKTIKVP